MQPSTKRQTSRTQGTGEFASEDGRESFANSGMQRKRALRLSAGCRPGSGGGCLGTRPRLSPLSWGARHAGVLRCHPQLCGRPRRVTQRLTFIICKMAKNQYAPHRVGNRCPVSVTDFEMSPSHTPFPPRPRQPRITETVTQWTCLS